MSFLQKQESRSNRNYWTPAFAGVTDWELLEVPINLKSCPLPELSAMSYELRPKIHTGTLEGWACRQNKVYPLHLSQNVPELSIRLFLEK